jgi:hypothetical protein
MLVSDSLIIGKFCDVKVDEEKVGVDENEDVEDTVIEEDVEVE